MNRNFRVHGMDVLLMCEWSFLWWIMPRAPPLTEFLCKDWSPPCLFQKHANIVFNGEITFGLSTKWYFLSRNYLLSRNAYSWVLCCQVAAFMAKRVPAFSQMANVITNFSNFKLFKTSVDNWSILNVFQKFSLLYVH